MSEDRRNPPGPAGRNARRNLRRLREERRFSYAELAERLARLDHHVTALDLSSLERGERRVDVDDLVALAAVFDCTLDQMLAPPAACDNCHGAPPVGFICIRCETTGLPARPTA
ncbi:helix-turn-helix domain-containing protein [Streptomyces sp. NPDC057620]|uniref:helix-turn-helix domain-containing protein n=1 Tax=Streptomyces sp. NPDC057620 TaxID=3346185 RepID=UPI0036B902C7